MLSASDCQPAAAPAFGIRPRICIIAQNAYGALVGGRRGHVGGAENQTAFLARWLAAKGYRVGLLTWDEGQPDDCVVDGVKVYKMCPVDAGAPKLRFLHPRLTSLWSAVRRADADVYYHNSAEYLTGLLAWWCRHNARRYIYSVASEVACDARLPAMSKAYERNLYRYGLLHANKIIVQTETQRRLLLQGFGVGSVLLPMPCAHPPAVNLGAVDAPPAPSVAWVGRADSMKRLEWVLEIAKRMPGTAFHLAVANISRCANADELYARASALSNVDWRWNVERTAMPDLYRQTTCLCCTSSYEGFPNTFLEAWSHARPVVTSFDPDGLVARRDLGMVARSVDEFVSALTELISSPSAWRKKSANARQYYLDRHSPEKVMPMFEREIVIP